MKERARVLNVRTTDAEMAMLVEVADSLGLSQSDTVRQLIRQAHELRFGMPSPTKKPKREKRTL